MQVVALLACLSSCPLVAYVPASGPSGPAGCRLWSSGRVPSFCPLVCFACGTLCLNMALFRVLRAFLAWFVGFMWVCVACALCVACVALYACGVRRFYGLMRVCSCFHLLCLPFVLLPFSFCLSFYLFASAFCPSPCLLCSGCFLLVLLSCLVCSCGLCVFFFPFGCTDKKKGRAVLVRPLFVCCECSNSCNVIEELRCRCFGSF